MPMASSKAPNHDFAPAWLKIPEHGNLKSPGAKSGEHLADKNGYYGYARRGREEMMARRAYEFQQNYAGAGGVMRPPRSYDPVYDERHLRRMEEEYYNGGAYYGGGGYPHGGPGYPPGFPPHHPAARYPPHMLGGYPPYPYGAYDMPPHADRYHSGGGGRQRRHSRGSNDKSSSNGGTPSKSTSSPTTEKQNGVENGAGDKGSSGDAGKDKGTSEKPLDEEFPSLGGETDCKEEKQDKCKPSAGVWDKNSVEKITNVKQSEGKENKNNCVRDVKSNNTNIYKALVPSKQSKLGPKRSGKDGVKSGVSSPRDINSNNSPKASKDTTNNESPSSAPMDILNTRTVTQPRTLGGDKKSDFLKALKDNDLNSSHSSTTHKCLENGVHTNGEQQHLVNGFIDLDLHDDLDLLNGDSHLNGDDDPAHHHMLSSSLEAEQRLLREMGWSEDEEQKPITEEEMKEIEALQTQLTQLKEQQQRNGLRTLPTVWSPQHMSIYSANSHSADDDEITSSSDSETES